MAEKERIVVLTGAGISQESGLKTFRDSDGLWEGHRVEDVATPEAFEFNPKLVYEFYNQRRKQLQTPQVVPNLAHLALAKLEQESGADFLLVTQNVDDLHERAGSKNLRHMHGSLLEARCVDTQEVFPWKEALDETSRHPSPNGRRGALRPHIVWFGEMPLYMDEIESWLTGATLFLSIGTSGQVYPAAGFVRWVPQGCRKVEINLQETGISPLFDEHRVGIASVEVTKFVEEWLAEKK